MDRIYYSIGETKGRKDAVNGYGMRDLTGWDADEAQGYIDGYNAYHHLAGE